MDFAFTGEQKDIQKAVKDFCRGEFSKELAMELDQTHEFPMKLFKKAAKLGFIGIGFPEEYSGQGLGVIEKCIVCEELCRGDSTIGSALALSTFAFECLDRYGSDPLRQKYLPPVAEGKTLSGGAFTEPNHGSDITRMDTTAVRDGDEWVINGTKIFITNAGIAGFFSVLVQTDPDADPPHRGMSLILVESDREGLSISDVGLKWGSGACPRGNWCLRTYGCP